MGMAIPRILRRADRGKEAECALYAVAVGGYYVKGKYE